MRGAAAVTILALTIASTSRADVPAALAKPTDRVVLTLSAIGVQVYECRAAAGGALAWAFKEPQALLRVDGVMVGRHGEGPSWEHMDGSKVIGKAVANVPAPAASDIPWLRVAVVSHEGAGAFGEVSAIQRVNTHGGVLAGPCPKAGDREQSPYTADYLMLKE